MFYKCSAPRDFLLTLWSTRLQATSDMITCRFFLLRVLKNKRLDVMFQSASGEQPVRQSVSQSHSSIHSASLFPVIPCCCSVFRRHRMFFRLPKGIYDVSLVGHGEFWHRFGTKSSLENVQRQQQQEQYNKILIWMITLGFSFFLSLVLGALAWPGLVFTAICGSTALLMLSKDLLWPLVWLWHCRRLLSPVRHAGSLFGWDFVEKCFVKAPCRCMFVCGHGCMSAKEIV